MDDILASIRRILAEDGAGAQAPAEDPKAVTAAPLSDALGEMDTGVRRPPLSDDAVDFDMEPEPPAQLPPPPSSAIPGPAETYAPANPSEDVFVLSPDMRTQTGKVVSQRAAEDSTDVLSQLARAILDRRDVSVSAREVTLESMVREMLRPLLREWLDRNLPYLIERLVRKEIDLMVNRAERLED